MSRLEPFPVASLRVMGACFDGPSSGEPGERGEPDGGQGGGHDGGHDGEQVGGQDSGGSCLLYTSDAADD